MEVYKNLEGYKQKNKEKNIDDLWDFFIEDALEYLEENRMPIQRLYDYEISLNINVSEYISDLPKEFKEPIILKRTLSKDLIRELSKEFKEKRFKELKNIKIQKEKEDFERVEEKEDFERVVKKEQETIKSLEEKEIYLIYFNNNLDIFSKYDVYIIMDFVKISSEFHLKNKTNIDDISIMAFLNGAIAIKDSKEYSKVENLLLSYIIYEEEGLKIEVDFHQILRSILEKFKLEAEEKREKQKSIEKFHKTYKRDKTQIFIPNLITRNNPFLLNAEEILKDEEIQLNSYWGYAIIKALSDTKLMDSTDIKNILTIYALNYSYIKYLKKEGLKDNEIIKTLVIDGLTIPLPLLAELRGIDKRKENYQRFLKSIEKAQALQIKGELSLDIKGEPVKIEKGFSLIGEWETITYKNKKAVNITLTRTPANLLLEEKGKPYNRKIINHLPDSLLPLYFYLDNMRLKNQKELTISIKNLIINSRLYYGKTTKERPDKVEKYLKDKLNKLKKGILIEKDLKVKLIKDWKDVELYNGEKGIKIEFEN